MKKAILKGIKQFLVVLAIMSFLLASVAYAQPQQVSQDQSASKPAEGGQPAGGSTGGTASSNATQLFPLPGASMYGNLPEPKQATAELRFQELMWGIIQNVRFIIGAVAIAFMVYSGFRMVTGWGNDEVYAKQRTNLLYSIIGLAIVGMSGEMSRIFSVSCTNFTAPGQTKLACTPGGFLNDPNAIVRASTIFDQRTKIIITFIKYFIGGVAVLEIVMVGLKMVTGGAEETITKAKKNLMYAVVGLILIIVADSAVSNVFYKLDKTRYPSVGGAAPAIDPYAGVKEIVGFTNLIVSIVGPVAVLALLGGGVMYITAAGKDETMTKAKRLIMAAIIGIIIIYGAFAIVSTFIAGSFDATPAPAA